MLQIEYPIFCNALSSSYKSTSNPSSPVFPCLHLLKHLICSTEYGQQEENSLVPSCSVKCGKEEEVNLRQVKPKE